MRWDYKSELVFWEGSGKSGGMTMEDYKQQVLGSYVVPAMKVQRHLYGRHSVLMEDGNRAHGLHNAGMKKMKKELRIRLFGGLAPILPRFQSH